MDNDIKVVKMFRKTIKQIKFKYDYRDINILSEEEGNLRISELIKSGVPGFVGRGGATEMRCINEYLSKSDFSNQIRDEILNLSGVFPTDTVNLKKFCNEYIEAISKADIVSLWGVGAEAKVIHRWCEKANFTELHALEPYYFSEPWSAALKGKKVLVVHPFKESILSQYNRRELLFVNKDILPKFADLTCIKAVQSIAGEETRFKTWFDALDFMKKEILKIDFDVAIIGAGAYGLPLCAFCKSIGKQAIQMSGATQILFGIKGRRWESIPYISNLFNEYWIRPNQNETPKKCNKVEGGSYW